MNKATNQPPETMCFDLGQLHLYGYTAASRDLKSKHLGFLGFLGLFWRLKAGPPPIHVVLECYRAFLTSTRSCRVAPTHRFYFLLSHSASIKTNELKDG